MVQVTEVGMVGGFAYTAWHILFKWYKQEVKLDTKRTDAALFKEADERVDQEKGMKSRTEDFGMTARKAGQSQIFEDWKRLPLPLRAQLVDDLADLTIWSGQWTKKPRRGVSLQAWADLSPTLKETVLLGLDTHLDFKFLETALESSKKMAGAWLWQPTDSLPLLSLEPTIAEQPVAELAVLLKKFETAETCVKTVLDSQRNAELVALKQAVQPLAVAQAMRNMQILKVLLEVLGLDTGKPAAARGSEIRALLSALVLEPASAELAEGVEAASKALDAEAEAEVAAERSVKVPGIEEAARVAYVNFLICAAEAAEVWKPTPGLLLPKVMVVEMLLGELASSVAGEPGAAELAASLARLVPKLASLIESEVNPELLAGLTSSQPAPASSELAGVLAAAALPMLFEEAEAKAAAAVLLRTPEQVVHSEVAGIFSRVTGNEAIAAAAEPPPATAVSMQSERNAMRREIEDAACAASAAVETNGITTLESKLATLRLEAAARARTALHAKLQGDDDDDDDEGLSAAEKVALLSVQIKALLSNPNDAELFTAAADTVMSIPLDDDSLAPGSETAFNAATSTYTNLVLAAEVKGLEMGTGASALLERIDAYLEGLEAAQQLALQQQQEEEAAAEGGAEEGARTPVHSPLKLDGEQIKKARGLVLDLLSEGLVLLELQTPSLRRLQSLRDTVDALTPGMDPAIWNRSVTLLKELVVHLGPIGAAVEARLGEVSEEVTREKLSALRTNAVAIYRALQEFIQTDSVTRVEMLKDLASIKEMVCSIKVSDKKSASLEASLALLTKINEKAVSITQAIQPMTAGEDAISEVYVMEEQVEKLQPMLKVVLQFVRLREAAMKPVATLPTADVHVALAPLASTLPMCVDPDNVLEVEGAETEVLSEYRQAGYKLIARGQAAVLLMAGGIDGNQVRVTKDIGLPSTKGLLQLFAERLWKVQKLATEALHGSGAEVVRPINWYIMTTPVTQAPIESFLKDGHYFGLDPAQVHVFACHQAPPLLSETLKVVMESPYKLARSQGGSGELFTALQESGNLTHMSRSGVKYLDVHTLEDNILAKPADPLFIGYTHSKGLSCTTKVLDPLAMSQVYDVHTASAAPSPASLVGDIAASLKALVPCTGAYCLSVPWIKEVAKNLNSRDAPAALYRLVPTAGIASKGAKLAGYKLERRLSDFVSLWAKHSGYVCVEPSQEFSLVWGNPQHYTPESPNSAVEDLLLLHTTWVEAAGGAMLDSCDASEGGVTTEGESGSNVVEVSPLVSYAGEGLETLTEGRSFKEAYELDLQGYAPQTRRQNNMGPWMIPFGVAYIALAALKLVGNK